ncbi:DUF1217 domain-containing protein [Methylobacterium sp. E-041]|uniref:DUF1217 domain-containing protein n=1 Tax=Methylobacterium sp. E-041 TaxID=2836573 RepID=UPI001FB98DA2|nr:DUF1217 domain-containing protein [Methylobacterium sp. E-041]MCJ2105832.1 DUF1217 domain-containing protein [Methylobacterium sp. E-041]
MSSTFTDYRRISANMPKALDRTASESSVKREVDYYNSRIGDVKTIDDLLADTRLYTFAMKAYGLDDMIYAKAFTKKALTGGLTDANSFANRLSDSRYKDFVAAFDFNTYGDKTTARPEAGKNTVAAYVQQTLESDAGADDEGVRLALYFKRKAPQIKSIFGILADKALGEVVRTALGLPAEVAGSNIDAQAALIGRKLDVASLKDPVALDAFIGRFTAIWDVRNDTTQSPALMLFNPSSPDMDTDLLLKLQNIRLGAL